MKQSTNTVVRHKYLKSKVATLLLFLSQFLSFISVGGFQEDTKWHQYELLPRQHQLLSGTHYGKDRHNTFRLIGESKGPAIAGLVQPIWLWNIVLCFTFCSFRNTLRRAFQKQKVCWFVWFFFLVFLSGATKYLFAFSGSHLGCSLNLAQPFTEGSSNTPSVFAFSIRHPWSWMPSCSNSLIYPLRAHTDVLARCTLPSLQRRGVRLGLGNRAQNASVSELRTPVIRDFCSFCVATGTRQAQQKGHSTVARGGDHTVPNTETRLLVAAQEVQG